MARLDPLPFRLHIPGKDTIDSSGVRSVSYRSEGRLHLMDDALILEWSATETVERVATDGIGTDVDHSPIGTCEVPVSWLAEARILGGLWWWWLRLRARRLDAFDGVPGARPGWLRLRVRRRDREHAKAFAEALNAVSAARPLTEGPGHDSKRSMIT